MRVKSLDQPILHSQLSSSDETYNMNLVILGELLMAYQMAFIASIFKVLFNH